MTQTAKTEVSNITDNLADRLQMKNHTIENMSLVNFGAEKPKIVKTSKVSLKLKFKDGH